MTAVHSQPGSVLKLASGAAHFRLGQIYWRQGKLADATAQLCLAASVEPNSSKIHFALGKLFHEQRRHEDAIAAYRRALEIAPTLSMAYQQLGLILQFDCQPLTPHGHDLISFANELQDQSQLLVGHGKSRSDLQGSAVRRNRIFVPSLFVEEFAQGAMDS